MGHLGVPWQGVFRLKAVLRTADPPPVRTAFPGGTADSADSSEFPRRIDPELGYPWVQKERPAGWAGENQHHDPQTKGHSNEAKLPTTT